MPAPHRPGPWTILPLLLILGVARPATAQEYGLDIATSGGYDDDILGRPGEDDTFPVISASFLQVAPTLAGGWQAGSWSFRGSWGYVFNAYNSAEAGIYHDNTGRAAIGVRPHRSVLLRLQGEAEWFHRTEFQDYDYDRLEISPMAAWQIDDRWSLQGVGRFGETSYPERQVLLARGETQVDQPEELELNVGIDEEGSWRLAAGGAWLSTASNSIQYEYDGYRLFLQADRPLGKGWSATGLLTWESRDYDRFLYFERVGSQVVRRTGRQDDSIWLTLECTRTLTPAARLFGGLSYLDYVSSNDDYSFDQTRVRAGLTLSFGHRASPAAGPASPWPGIESPSLLSPLAPRIGEGTVLFRCRAPEAASVHLVGSFNGWRETATPMTRSAGEGDWEVEIPLAPGLYRYMFLIDGREWRRPEAAPFYEEDDFGQENGVLDVSGAVTTPAAGGPSVGSQRP